MSTAKSFEDLFVWQKSRELANLAYTHTKKSQFSRDRGLADQIQRAAVSVMSNISEGFERGSKEETLYFLYIAKGSCGEVRAQLYIAFDQDYIGKEELEKGIELARYVSALISKFIASLKVSEYKGLKFKNPGDKNKQEFKDLMLSYLPENHPLRKNKR